MNIISKRNYRCGKSTKLSTVGLQKIERRAYGFNTSSKAQKKKEDNNG